MMMSDQAMNSVSPKSDPATLKVRYRQRGLYGQRLPVHFHIQRRSSVWFKYPLHLCKTASLGTLPRLLDTQKQWIWKANLVRVEEIKIVLAYLLTIPTLSYQNSIAKHFMTIYNTKWFPQGGLGPKTGHIGRPVNSFSIEDFAKSNLRIAHHIQYSFTSSLK